MPLKDTVIYPFVGAPLAVGQERTLKLIDDAVVGNRLVGFVASKDSSIDNPGPDQAYRVGVVGAIMRMMRLPNGTMQLAVQGLERIKIEEYTQTTPYLKARIRLAPDEVDTGHGDGRAGPQPEEPLRAPGGPDAAPARRTGDGRAEHRQPAPAGLPGSLGAAHGPGTAPGDHRDRLGARASWRS